MVDSVHIKLARKAAQLEFHTHIMASTTTTSTADATGHLASLPLELHERIACFLSPEPEDPKAPRELTDLQNLRLAGRTTYEWATMVLFRIMPLQLHFDSEAKLIQPPFRWAKPELQMMAEKHPRLADYVKELRIIALPYPVQEWWPKEEILDIARRLDSALNLTHIPRRVGAGPGRRTHRFWRQRRIAEEFARYFRLLYEIGPGYSSSSNVQIRDASRVLRNALLSFPNLRVVKPGSYTYPSDEMGSGQLFHVMEEYVSGMILECTANSTKTMRSNAWAYIRSLKMVSRMLTIASRLKVITCSELSEWICPRGHDGVHNYQRLQDA